MGTAATAETMKLAVTTSFHNSGLSDVLLPAIQEDIGLEVQLLVVGTGQALRLGEAGDVDAILVHSKAAEERFVAEGYGPYRREIMYNDFVFVGPQADLAGVRDASAATDALKLIAAAKAPFVSRGDDSGTHKKEMSLWSAAEISPEGQTAWYNSVGAGMGASLNTASGLEAYIIADRASWLNFANKGTLDLLYSGDQVLFNQYAYLPVDPIRHPHVNNDAAVKLEAWLTSPTAEALINGYTINNEALFVFNAQSK
jgi:tungstate transport system substrate-binding protein